MLTPRSSPDPQSVTRRDSLRIRFLQASVSETVAFRTTSPPPTLWNMLGPPDGKVHATLRKNQDPRILVGELKKTDLHQNHNLAADRRSPFFFQKKLKLGNGGVGKRIAHNRNGKDCFRSTCDCMQLLQPYGSRLRELDHGHKQSYEGKGGKHQNIHGSKSSL